MTLTSNNDPFVLMQQAVDVVNTGDHPTNKISALLHGKHKNGNDFSVVSINLWPKAISDKLGYNSRIGNASGTVHAETMCVINSPCSLNSYIFVTDPPCPNCAKNMAEAGVKKIFIDHKGFEKDFYNRRQEDFATMSLDVFNHAGISVYKIFRKEKRIEPIIEAEQKQRESFLRHNSASGVKIIPVKSSIDNDESFHELINIEKKEQHNDFAIAVASDPESKDRFFIYTEKYFYAEKSYEEKFDTQSANDRKYSPVIEPANRMLMLASRYGLILETNNIFSSKIPTAREMVNLCGAGFTKITINDISRARDHSSIDAMNTMKYHQITDFIIAPLEHYSKSF